MELSAVIPGTWRVLGNREIAELVLWPRASVSSSTDNGYYCYQTVSGSVIPVMWYHNATTEELRIRRGGHESLSNYIEPFFCSVRKYIRERMKLNDLHDPYQSASRKHYWIETVPLKVHDDIIETRDKRSEHYGKVLSLVKSYLFNKAPELNTELFEWHM